MNIKLLGMTGLGIAIALLAIPVISNSSNSSQSVQRYANIARVDQNDATVHRFNHQTSHQSLSHFEFNDAEVEEEALHEPTEAPRQWGRSNPSMVIAESYSVQESSVSLGISELKTPCMLTVRPMGGATQIKGSIKLNGRILKGLNPGVTQINLSPYLRKGRQTVEVLGSYQSAQGSVEVTLQSPSTEMSQETGGSGIVKQAIVVEVQ